MPSYALVRVLRIVCPLAASFFILATIIACVVIVKVNHIWVSGRAWPFLSEMGRDPPAYYVLCAGLTLVAVLLILTWLFNWFYHSSALPLDAMHLRVIAFICCLAGVVASFGLPILAFFDTAAYPILHSAATVWFFCFETIAISINTYLSYKLYEALKTQGAGVESGTERVHKRKKTLEIQVIFLTTFWVAFVIYMPVGMSLASETKRLTVADCLKENFGSNYCTKTERLNATLTRLYDDRGAFAVNQMSAGAQLACILSLVGYSISFATNDYTGADVAARGATGGPHDDQERLIHVA